MKHKVLVVDDDPDTSHGLGIRLRAEGFDTVFAANAKAAINKAKTERPDLVLLDLGLPGETGLDVLQRMSASSELASIPVVVVSAFTDEIFRHEAMVSGARAFVPKPIDNSVLMAAIRDQLQDVPAGTPVAPGRRILLIEDDEDTASGLAIRLKAEGFVVSRAIDAASVMGIAARDKSELIILDLGLPDADGQQLLNRLKQNQQTARLPVIVLSAREAETHRDMCLATGAVAYFQRSADTRELLAAIRKYLSPRKTEHLQPRRNS